MTSAQIFWTVIAGLLVLVIAYFGNKIYLWFVDKWKKMWGKITIPDTKVVLVLVPYRTFWNTASRDGKPAMQINTSWHATNASNVPIRILDAGLSRPNVRGRICRTILMMVDKQNVAHQGTDWPIGPNQTETVEVCFFVEPPTQKQDTSLILKLFVVDQYGRKHKAPRIKMRYAFPSAETF